MRADAAATLYRSAVAAELRIEGMSYDDIARTLGYANRSGAWKAVTRALRVRQASAGRELWEATMVDLEMLHERAWGRAMRGDPSAVAICLEVGRRRVALLNQLSQAGGRGDGDE